MTFRYNSSNIANYGTSMKGAIIVGIDLIHGDCLEVMKTLEDKSVDLIITSPPYNLGTYHHTRNKVFKSYTEYKDDMPEELYQEWQIEVLKECYRLLKDDGSMFYNHKNRIKDGKQISPYEWLFKTDFIIKQELVWMNGTPNFDKCRFYPMTERVYWLSKSVDTKMYNHISHMDVFSGSEWKSQGTKGEHKRAFPAQLPRDIICCFREAEVVLDPFMGSGTTGVIAAQSGKHFIGIEIDEGYFNLAKSKIKENEKGNTLF